MDSIGRDTLFEIIGKYIIHKRFIEEIKDAEYHSVSADEITSSNNQILSICKHKPRKHSQFAPCKHTPRKHSQFAPCKQPSRKHSQFAPCKHTPSKHSQFPPCKQRIINS